MMSETERKAETRHSDVYRCCSHNQTSIWGIVRRIVDKQERVWKGTDLDGAVYTVYYVGEATAYTAAFRIFAMKEGCEPVYMDTVTYDLGDSRDSVL